MIIELQKELEEIKIEIQKNEFISFEFILKKEEVFCKHCINYNNKNINNKDNEQNYNSFLFSLTSVLNFFGNENSQKEIKKFLVKIQKNINEQENLEKLKTDLEELVFKNTNNNEVKKINQIFQTFGEFNVKEHIFTQCNVKNNNELKKVLDNAYSYEKMFALETSNIDNIYYYTIRKVNLCISFDNPKNKLKYELGNIKTLKLINESLKNVITINGNIVKDEFFEKHKFTQFNKRFTSEELLQKFKTLSIKQNLKNF